MDRFIYFEKYKQYTILQGHRYWPKGRVYIHSLPVCSIDQPVLKETLPPKMVTLELPEWADDIGINHRLLIPKICIKGKKYLWEEVDWFLAVFWYLSGFAESQLEHISKPVHSYSFNLKGWDERIWQHAWANRILLFLRRWAAIKQDANEKSLFGDLPEFKIHLTHDVDAVFKTPPVRIKQSGFHIYNSAKSLINQKYNLFFKHLLKAWRFLFLPDNYWCFEQIQNIEKQYNQTSCFNFFAGKKSNTLKNWLFNPGYNIASHELTAKIKELQQKKWQIGLHQGFENWSDGTKMKKDKKRLEKIAGKKISQCRQHWLKFSWEKTWKAQEQAGFKIDTTLAFNDRPGFRTGAALCYHPWDFAHERQMNIKALPTMFMDSHFYDYSSMNDLQRKKAIKYWIDEVRKVRGEAAIIWHQRVFAPDYSWNKGYEYVLREIKK